jgi:hypothetical protein
MLAKTWDENKVVFLTWPHVNSNSVHVGLIFRFYQVLLVDQMHNGKPVFLMFFLFIMLFVNHFINKFTI